MAHWISSKLKVAENFLQQIDEQAAESLRKNEKPRSDELGLETSPKSTETKPLKDQLKKKLHENDDLVRKSRSDRNLNLVNTNSISNIGSGSGSGGGSNTTINAGVTKEVKPTGGDVRDTDWTQLLGVPKKGLSGVVRSRDGAPGVRGVRKDGRRHGGLGSGANLSALDGKRSQKSQNGDVKTLRKLDNQLGSKVSGAGLDDKVSDGGEATPRTSTVDLRTDGESFERSHLHGEEKGAMVNSGIKDEDKNERNEDFDSVGDDKLNSNGDTVTKARPPVIASPIPEGNFDLKVGIKGDKVFKSATKEADKFAEGSRSSTSSKKGSLTPSDEDSDSDTGSTSSSDSESEHEREERRKRRQQILAEKAAAKAVEAIKERENIVARLEGEKQSLEKILDERAKQQVQEASELQSTMMETMEAVELEKQKHNNTRMEVLTRLAKLETTNADLARSFAAAQWNLGVEVNHVAELHQQIELKEASCEDLRRKLSSTSGGGDKAVASKGIELEKEMLEAEYSFLTDKVARRQDKAKTLEASIESTRREFENPTEVEIELKRRLNQLTDHLIQKQAQVEALSSEKATLVFKIEAVSRSLDESQATVDPSDFPSTSSRDLESGLLQLRNSNLRPLVEARIRSGKQHLGSLVRQLDSIFCAGAVFLRRNSTARIWSVVYLVCLHVWVLYILSSHSPVSDEDKSGAVFSLQNINNTGGV